MRRIVDRWNRREGKEEREVVRGVRMCRRERVEMVRGWSVVMGVNI